jgi:hypothetical protein
METAGVNYEEETGVHLAGVHLAVMRQVCRGHQQGEPCI